MNVKFKHEIVSHLPLVKLNKVFLMPKTYETKMFKSAIENTKASSTYEEIFNEGEDETITLSSSFIPIRVMEPRNNQDIRGYCKMQAGSKEIQKKLKEMSDEEISQFINEITPFLSELLEDDYANYMVQTLVSCSNSTQRLEIFKALEQKIVDLICLKQGTFAFQQMISCMETEQ